MANEVSLFNFYHRFLWNENNFTSWQEAMISHMRAMFEGLFNSAVMQGMEVTPGGALSVDVSSGIASGPSGYLHAPQGTENVALSAPTGSDPVKAIIVARPDLVPETYISRPTAPFDSVPLRTKQGNQCLALYGTPAPSPTYPSKGVNDVILAGIELSPGQGTVPASAIDYSVRDVPGKNSLQNFHPAFTVSPVTAAHIPSVNGEIVVADVSGGTFAVSLPDATLNEGLKFTVKKVDSSATAVTVDTVIGGQTIEGQSSIQLTEQFQFVEVVSDGSNYHIVSAG